jgi:ATP-dependent Clp protease ATP-binding subunit ClpA
MYERFTDRARKAMKLAKRNAYSAEVKTHPEHVFCAIDKGGVASTALKALGFDLQELQQKVGSTSGPFEEAPRTDLAHDHDADSTKELINKAMELARSLNHNYVGDEHLLLAAFVTESHAASVLSENGVKYDAVRAAVCELLGHDDPENPKPETSAPNSPTQSTPDHDVGIEIYVDPGDASAETIRNVLTSLSDLHFAAGGCGLEYVADDLHIHIVEGVLT